MNIFVCENHNEVLFAWDKLRNLNCNVISLDSHTDTHKAFLCHACKQNQQGEEQEIILFRSQLMDKYKYGHMTLSEAVDLLKNDEHVFFAIETNMINNFFVIPMKGPNNIQSESIFVPGSSKLDFESKIIMTNEGIQYSKEERFYAGERIIEYDIYYLQEPPFDDECLMRFAKMALEDNFIDNPISFFKNCQPNFFNNYILDIDLDYFRLKSSLHPTNYSIFSQLVKNAKMITIAKEPHCFCPLDESDPVTSQYAL